LNADVLNRSVKSTSSSGKRYIGLVDAVAVHRVVKCRRGKGVGMSVRARPPQLLQHAFEQRVDILRASRTTLDVHLREFPSGGRTEVLVAEAARDLEYFSTPATMRICLELLRRLRKRVNWPAWMREPAPDTRARLPGVLFEQRRRSTSMNSLRSK